MSYKLFDGGPFRILTSVDCHTREALATTARTNFRAYQLIDELDQVMKDASICGLGHTASTAIRSALDAGLLDATDG